MRSIHIEVRQAVIDGIAATLAGSDSEVDVSYGWQGSSDVAAREQIYTSNARATHAPAGLKSARLFRDEKMSFDVNIYVELIDGPPDEAETRAMDLGQTVEEFIADRKSNELGITGLKWIRITDLASDYRIGQNGGSLAIVTYTVHYEARLT